MSPGVDWAKEEEVGSQGNHTHLWEESWDDDDTTDDFSVQLKYVSTNELARTVANNCDREELKKMESQRKG